MLCEIYKYEYLMNTIFALEEYKDYIIKVDFHKYWAMVQEKCVERIHNIQIEKQKYPQLKDILKKYTSDTRSIAMPVLTYVSGRENDYMVADLMSIVLANILHSLVVGDTYDGCKILDIIQEYPVDEVCGILNTYIYSIVVLRLGVYGRK